MVFDKHRFYSWSNSMLHQSRHPLSKVGPTAKSFCTENHFTKPYTKITWKMTLCNKTPLRLVFESHYSRVSAARRSWLSAVDRNLKSFLELAEKTSVNQSNL